MLTAQAQLMCRIRRYLSIWAVNVGLDNRVGLTDINKEAEDFYCGLLNAVLDAKLKNLNLLKMDFPAVDLGDGEKRLCIQVTSTAGREKIDHTLDRFFKYELFKQYDRLIVTIIGDRSRKNYRMDALKKGKFSFDPERDVWDTARLILEIGTLEMDRLRRVEAWLEEQLGPLPEQPAPLELPLKTSLEGDRFVGRRAELELIAERFETERIVVLSGLGGMGKTELAIRFGREYADSGAGRACFVGFRGDFFRTVAEGVAMGIEGLAEQKLSPEEKYREAMKALRRCSREDLLIVDNADTEAASFEDLRRELSALPMRILITTRWDPVGRIDVGALRREELRSIFRRYAGEIPVADMDKLIDAVDHHTLTVDLMARSMQPGRRAATAEKLLTALNDRDLNSPAFMRIATSYPGGLRQARISEHLRTVFRVAGLSDAEQQLLRCAALLPAGGMSDELFMLPFGEEMQDVLDDLIRKGWLEWQKGLLRIHPVICIVCREELKPTEETCGAFVDGVWGWYDRKKYDHVRYSQMAELFTAADAVLDDPSGWYIGQAGFLWLHLGDTRQALGCNLKSVERKELSQPDSNNLAAAYNNVGSTYGDLGDHKRALEYQLKALAIREKVLPPDHPDLATSYNNVGLAYGQMGDREKKLEYYLKALTIFEKVLPPDHPYLATSYNNVGLTYGNLGDHKRALEYQRKALVIREKVLPPTHPDLAQSCNNVGIAYGDLGDREKELEYVLKALAIWEEVLPPEHPDLATSYNNVGYTYGQMGDREKELEYKMKAHDIWEKVLPPNHPDLALSCNNLAWTYYKMSEYDTALDLMRRAAVIAERSLPEEHPDRVEYCRWAEDMERKARQRRDAE